MSNVTVGGLTFDGNGNLMVGGNRLLVAQMAIPFINAPTGTMANNGAITLGTALANTYANAYINLPASAISAGSAAGWYFCQMSSATLGTVFNNTYTSGPVTIPASPTPFVTTGPGAYTGVTSAIQGPSFSVPGNSLGLNGSLYYEATWSLLNNANVKTLSGNFGGQGICAIAGANFIAYTLKKNLQNRGSTGSQVTEAAPGNAGISNTGGPSITGIDTTAAQTFYFGFTMATATDYIVIERCFIEAIPG